jgi:hypothetical protein
MKLLIHGISIGITTQTKQFAMNSKIKLEITMNAGVSLYKDAKDFVAFKKWLHEVMIPTISKQKKATEKLYSYCLLQQVTYSLS